jgi:2-polyprenyl-3-methyl-5-hydroxy-6-metoxy-1,4-benzoquinol methylase
MIGRRTEVLNKAVIGAFWEAKANESSSRWTAQKLLAHEFQLLGERIGSPMSVLDLGSGSGDLSRMLAQDGAQLTAVDQQVGFRRFFVLPHEHFEVGDVIFYENKSLFDLVLLFGVVTHLEWNEEEAVYGRIAKFTSPGGVAVVKNQCAHDGELVVNEFSTELGLQYSARYPTAAAQAERLRRHFASVEHYDYPEEFSPWNNTSHVAFFCREPLRPDPL